MTDTEVLVSRLDFLQVLSEVSPIMNNPRYDYCQGLIRGNSPTLLWTHTYPSLLFEWQIHTSILPLPSSSHVPHVSHICSTTHSTAHAPPPTGCINAQKARQVYLAITFQHEAVQRALQKTLKALRQNKHIELLLNTLKSHKNTYLHSGKWTGIPFFQTFCSPVGSFLSRCCMPTVCHSVFLSVWPAASHTSDCLFDSAALRSY